MDTPNTILVYSDYKSPYAFLAKDLIYELEDQFDVRLEWLPYTLDIPSYLGSATLDERGEVMESNRNGPPMAPRALLVHGLPPASKKAGTCDTWDPENIGFLYRRDWHVVG
jgi:2-hydroxychromene-2-carboxylate isomerase